MTQPALAFSATATALLQGHMVRAVFGVKLELRNETLYLCQGDSFTDNTGQAWTGLGLLGSIAGVQCGPEAVASPLQLTLSGVVMDDKTRADVYPALARAIADSNAEILGGWATVYWMMFDQTTGQAVDLPFMLQVYQLGRATFAYDGATNAVTLTVPGDPLFALRHVPPMNLVSDADQQNKYPGDHAFERMGWKKTVITQ